MQAATDEADVIISDMATIDTDTGVVRDHANIQIPVTSSVVSQTGTDIEIRAFIGKSFRISSVLVTGHRSIAFVSPGEVLVDGLIDVSAKAAAERSGSGQQSSGMCVGQSVAVGGGGGGNATSGGRGLNTVSSQIAAGGLQQTTGALVGGCAGGNSQFDGFGGGAIQIDSLGSVSVSETGGINVAGAGGSDKVGGGSGGTVIIEAPHVAILGKITANGGGGGACGLRGDDGSLTTSPASAPSGCGTSSLTHGGPGGSITAAPGDGTGVGGGGGGGGAIGRLVVSTVGQYETGATTVLSVQSVTTTLNPL